MILIGSPTDLTTKSTLRFTFSSERPRTPGIRLHNSKAASSENPTFFKCSSFRSKFSFPIAIITCIARENSFEPLVRPKFSACLNESVIFFSEVVSKRGCFANNCDNASPSIPNSLKNDIALLSLGSRLRLKTLESVEISLVISFSSMNVLRKATLGFRFFSVLRNNKPGLQRITVRI
eukprot:Gb_26170 [translate_table: standard]